MANFPFDPTPFLPPDRVALEVAGRPARVRVIHGEMRLTNEDLAIVTIIPMPQGEVAFQNVHEILGEYFAEKRVAIKSISKCPFGQAYVRFESVEDRDWFVGNGPHVCDDVHLLFQKHNEGLNWRKFNLNREVWIQMIGYPADLRCMHELANAVKSFGMLLLWDRVKSTDAYVLVKIAVVALSDIPTSTAISGADRFSGEAWTVPIVILQDQLLGGGPPDEEDIPVDGVPHPMPPEQFHHPNQNIHMIGPIPAHEEVEAPVDNGPPVANQVVNHPVHIAIENQLAENAVAWDHWALPPAGEMVDMELHAGEFLELNDLIGPAVELPDAVDVDNGEIGSDLTLTLNLPSEDNSSDNSIQGPPMTNAQLIAPLLPHQFLDLNIPAQEDIAPIGDHEVDNNDNIHVPALDIFPFPGIEEDPSNEFMVVQNQMMDTAAVEGLSTTPMSALVLSTEIDNNITDAPRVSHNSENELSPAALLPCKKTSERVPGDNDPKLDNTDKTANPHVEGTITMNTDDVAAAETDDSDSGEEGLSLWKIHFAPKSDTDKVTQVPIEWMNFFTAALLSIDKYDWAKTFLATQLWSFIVEGTDSASLRPFVIPDICPVSQKSICDVYNMEQEQNETTPDKAICGPTGNATTSAIHAKRKRKEKAPLVETEVRRSTRLEQLQKGFKKSTCMNKQCINCSARPPIISAKIVRNLAVSFCKVDPGDCSEEELHKKEKKKKKVQKEMPQNQKRVHDDGN
ncbi:unnamed protein product [Alopecurus aequalis]